MRSALHGCVVVSSWHILYIQVYSAGVQWNPTENSREADGNCSLYLNFMFRITGGFEGAMYCFHVNKALCEAIYIFC